MPKTAIDTYVDFVWESSDSKVANIDKLGNLSARNKGEVKITLTAYYTDSNNIQKEVTDEITIKVVPANLKSIKFDKESLEIVKGQEATLTVTSDPLNSEIGELEWLSTNENIATVSDGVIKGIDVGQTTIVVTVKGTNISASCKVDITPVELISIEFKEKNKTLLINEKFQTEIIFNPDNIENKKVIYSSSDNNIATIDENGIITAISKGSATITAVSEDGNKTATCDIDVQHFTDRIFMLKSGSIVSINGWVTATANITLHNSSGKTIFVKKFNVISNGNEVYNLDINENLNTSQELTRGITYNNVYMPVYKYTYSVDGKDYEVEINGY